MPIAFTGFQRGMLSRQKAPIAMDMTEKRVTFSGPESSAEMEVLSGCGSKPVKVLNLPGPAFQDDTQFTSITHEHRGAVHPFRVSGTNGFTSTMDVGTLP